MTDPLPMMPFRRPAEGAVELPGSKSLTNRALILAALCAGETALSGVLFSRDTRILLGALEQLGLPVRQDPAARAVWIEGGGGSWPVAEARLDVGNAGTAARFLTAMLALHPRGRYHLDGDEAMRGRPMRQLLAALEAQGARFHFRGEPGCFPFTMETAGLSGGRVEIESQASSQFVSALLMVAPGGRAPLELATRGVRPSFVRITQEMLRQFGVPTHEDGAGVFTVEPAHRWTSPGIYAIEPDVTAASYFLALPRVTGGAILLPGLKPSLLQGDAVFAEVVTALGVRVGKEPHGWQVSVSRDSPWPGLDRDFENFSDTFLTLAAIAPLADEPTTIRGIGHTRRQETDRIAAMARELRKTGCRVDEEAEALRIVPQRDALRDAALRGIEIETYEDHRIAMSFAILGCADLRPNHEPWLRIRDPACCGKTFPDFFAKLAALHAASHV